jgi:quinol monooxygenase YgiN
VRPERRDEALAAARRLQQATRREAGCRDYGFWVATDDPDALLLFERWEDAAALETHLATPHVAEFSAAVGDFVDGPLAVDRYEVDDPPS